jgi:hypothetical protein
MINKLQAYYASLFISVFAFCYLTFGRQVIEKEGSLAGAVVHGFSDFLVSCFFLLIPVLAIGAAICAFLAFKKYELSHYLIPLAYAIFWLAGITLIAAESATNWGNTWGTSEIFMFFIASNWLIATPILCGGLYSTFLIEKHLKTTK